LGAKEALTRLAAGEWLLFEGDFHLGRQLLLSVQRRLEKKPDPSVTPLAAFRAQRQARHEEHRVLGRLLVELNASYVLSNRRAPDVRQACEEVWGPAAPEGILVSLRELLGMMGAAEWRRKGLSVPGLKGALTPHYGVFSPTRHEYVSLVLAAPSPKGKTVFEVGTGMGVLSFILLQRGAARVVATDVEPRAVTCAQENAQKLGLADRFEVREQSLFPEGRADLVVFNPPWLPEQPMTRLDRAVFDEGGEALAGFLRGLPEHLTPGGEGYLLVSNFAELLGLRPKGYLSGAINEAGLTLKWKRAGPPSHPKAKDSADPLHALRRQEVTSLYCLAAATTPRLGP
jgi:methylase of polypeptide subunit release factors